MSQNPGPALKDLQRQLRFDVTHFDFLEGSTPPSTSWIKAKPPLARTSRLEIYAEAWFLRILGALADDYESLQRLLGETTFERMVRHYATRHPSRTHTLGHIGNELAEFLSHWPETAQNSAAIALAQLERGWLQCFNAAEATPWDPQGLASLNENDWGRLRLRREDHAVILTLPCCVHDFWLENTKALIPGAEHILLWRRGGTVLSRVVSKEETLALTALGQSTTLETLLEFCGEDHFLPWLTSWGQDHLIRVEGS